LLIADDEVIKEIQWQCSSYSSDHWQHQWALSTYSAFDVEEFPCRNNFATRNELKTQEGYGKYPSTDRETIANLSQKY